MRFVRSFVVDTIMMSILFGLMNILLEEESFMVTCRWGRKSESM